MTDAYDLIIIGAGQAGVPLASAFARAGRKTALIEATHVGGTCVNEGCTPTKTMVASARVAHMARRGADYGVKTGPVEVDLEVVRRRKREIVQSWSLGSERYLRSDGVDLLMGEGTFSGPKTVRVRLNEGGERELRAEQIVINAGARPARPDLPGIEHVATLDSTSIMELGEVPEHLIVLGGGYIGLEFGQMFRRFGSRVTIVQRRPYLLAREDNDIAEAVAAIMRSEGIDLLLEHNPLHVAREGSDGIRLRIEGPAGEREVIGSHLLVAAGRTPNSDRLNLSATGITPGRGGFIPVNAQLETEVPGIYAVGDVKGGPAFTHISYDDSRVLKTNLLEGGSASIDGRMVPYTVFIDPQLGRIGLTEAQARAESRKIKVAKLPMSSVARAIEIDETHGLMKAVIDADSDQILGFAMLGIEGGEIAGAVQIAMMGRLPYTVLRDSPFSHPTLTESLNNLFGSVAA
jgi:pyruvate/2-oxoglutarate dehydrogenase complex dihydrolipoamide dehydrogenase (E3) component